MLKLDHDSRLDFLLVGAQKSGTTALAAYLRDHPEIYVFGEQEGRRSAHYFNNEKIHAQKQLQYKSYHDLFKPAENHKVVGESTPIYMYWHDAPRRIWEYNPKIKILAILRNPIERAYSAWNMERDRGAEELSFHEALLYEVERCRSALPHKHSVFSYIDRGYYSSQIRELWRYFPKENTLFLKSEYLRSSPQNTLKKVFSFLNVTPMDIEVKKNIHTRKYQRSMNIDEFEFLKNKFEFEIRALERILGWDCTNWFLYNK